MEETVGVMGKDNQTMRQGDKEKGYPNPLTSSTTTHQYDVVGNLTKTTDPLGRVTQYRYDAGNRRVAMIYPDKTERHYAYNAAGQLTAETNELGQVTKRSYDAHGNLATLTDPAGNITTTLFTSSVGVPPASAKGSAGVPPASGGIPPPQNNATKGAKNLPNLTTTPSSSPAENGKRPTENQHRAAHRPTGTRTAAGVITQVEYDLLGHRTAQTLGEAEANQTLRQGDNQTGQKSPAVASASPLPNSKSPPLIVSPSSPSAPAITRHQYDPLGNELATTSPTGKITLHTYDALNRRITTTDALGRVWKYSYAATTGPTGNPPCCGADPTNNARAATTTFPDGTQETRITDAAGQLVETTDAKGDKIQYAYDPDGRLTTLTDANGHITRWTYDPRGKLESKTYPDKTAEYYAHDAAGQLLTRTRPDGTTAVHTYDQRGHLRTIRWNDNKTEPTTYTYDKAGHLLTAQNTSATITRSYTSSGKIATEEQSITASFGEEEKGISNKEQGAGEAAGTLPATENGQRKTGNIYLIAYTYNPDNRLASITYPDQSLIGYQYDTNGHLAKVTEALPPDNGAERSETDSHRLPTGRSEAESKPKTDNVLASYTRNPDGQVAQLHLANGLTTTKNYDAVGRLQTIAHLSPDGTVLASETSRYDQRDRRTAKVAADGTADLFAYDPAGQVIAAAYAQAQSSAGVPPVSAPQAPQPPATPATENGQPKTENTLSFTPQQSFQYDPAGNRKTHSDPDGTKTTYQTNEANQYTAITPASPTENGQQKTENTTPAYDKNGNLLTDPNNTYTWDADIHLLSVTTKNTNKGKAPASSSTTQFRYDPLHRRVARLESNGTLTHFIHDGWNVIAEYQSSHELQLEKTSPAPDSSKPNTQPRAGGLKSETTSPGTQPNAGGLKPSTTLSTHLAWGEDLSRTLQGAGGIAGLLVSHSASAHQPSTTSYFSYDSNGNVILLTNSETKPTARYAYDAYGRTSKATGPAAQSNPYRFSTKPIEITSGLAFYGFRYYSPELGRWTARDPIGERGGLNLLAMCSNSSVNNYDVLGQFSDCFMCVALIAGLHVELSFAMNAAALCLAAPEFIAPCGALAATVIAIIKTIDAAEENCKKCREPDIEPVCPILPPIPPPTIDLPPLF